MKVMHRSIHDNFSLWTLRASSGCTECNRKEKKTEKKQKCRVLAFIFIAFLEEIFNKLTRTAHENFT